MDNRRRYEPLHPDSLAEIRDLIELHGAACVRDAINEIEQNEWERAQARADEQFYGGSTPQTPAERAEVDARRGKS